MPLVDDSSDTRLLVPPLLRPGDRITVVAPSGPYDAERLASGIACLERLGLDPVCPAGIDARDGYLAGSDERRTAELDAAISVAGRAAVWPVRGGYGATRIIGSIDPRAVAEHPRWLVGFSDITALHALWRRAGVVSVHGPNVATLADTSEAAMEALRRLLFEGVATPLRGDRGGAGESVEGVLAGGNATVLAAMAGTGHLPHFHACIVVLEDVREAPYRLDRVLTQLRFAGAFDGVRGFAIGQLSACHTPAPGEPSAIEAVRRVLGGLGVPVVAGFPVGHDVAASLPVPFGWHARLDPASGLLSPADY